MKVYQCSFAEGMLYLKWDTYYIFEEDVEGKEIHFHGNNITLDLSDHTIQVKHIKIFKCDYSRLPPHISISNGKLLFKSA